MARSSKLASEATVRHVTNPDLSVPIASRGRPSRASCATATAPVPLLHCRGGPATLDAYTVIKRPQTDPRAHTTRADRINSAKQRVSLSRAVLSSSPYQNQATQRLLFASRQRRLVFPEQMDLYRPILTDYSLKAEPLLAAWHHLDPTNFSVPVVDRFGLVVSAGVFLALAIAYSFDCLPDKGRYRIRIHKPVNPARWTAAGVDSDEDIACFVERVCTSLKAGFKSSWWLPKLVAASLV